MPIMGHLVMGYPSLEKSYQNARTYAKAGFEIFRQIHFSHPAADGTKSNKPTKLLQKKIMLLLKIALS